VSLVELMIALLLGAVVVLGGINLYLLMVRGEQDVSERNRLTDEFRAMANVLSRDLRRAGFWEADLAMDELWNNPFTAADTDLQISARTGEAANSCILYSYDIDRDGTVGDLQSPPAATQERFGFRLNDQTIESYSGGNWSCDAGNWERLSTPGVEVTGFALDPNETIISFADPAVPQTVSSCPSGASCQYIRSVRFTMTGRLRRDPGVTEILQGSVRLRNDKFEPGGTP
jgi:prepilin peptidase dependent protein B